MHLYPTDTLPLLLLAIGAVVITLVARRSFAAASAGMRRFSLGVRLVVLALLALALMDIQARRTGDTRAVVVALDRSRSVPSRLRDQSEAFAKDVIPEMGEKDRLGLVLFGETASLEYLPTASPPTGAFQSIVKTDHTDLAAAVRLARAAFPEGAAKRILLVTDGNETRGDVRAEARAAHADGVRIDVLPLAYRHEAEVAVERVTVPPKADEGETVEVRVTVSSTRETPATLYLREDGALVATERVQLRPGKNSFVVPRSLIPGFHTYEATVDPEADTIPANNRGFAFTHVHGEPRVLLVESQPELAQPLAAALEPHGIHLEVAGPSGLPASVGDLQNYDCLILSNVPATAFTPEQMKLVQGTVRDLGMGLIMIGGDQSFGQGGYQNTPIEEALPVDMEIRQKRVLPNGALVLIMHTCEIPDGNSWAREIAKEAIRVLSAQDLVGVTYWGGMGYQWLFPLQPASNKGKLFRLLDDMSPGDMPDFDSTLQMAYKALKDCNASLRHIVVASDMDPAPPSPGLIQRIKDARISITAVELFGHGNPRAMEPYLSKPTGGRYYAPTDSRELPRIFIKEALTVRRSLICEQTFKPATGHPSEVLQGIDLRAVPPLHGYVITSPKDEAFVPLTGPEADPILAHWQYGLGRALAFASDAKPKWGRDWLSWAAFSRFWGQAVRWTSRSLPRTNYRLTVETQGDQGKIVLDALDTKGGFVNGLSVETRGLAPDASSVGTKLRQTGPGRYEGEVPLSQVGVYLMNATFQAGAGGDGQQRGALFAGLAVNYSPEYAARSENQPLLREVAEITGGRVLSLAESGSVFVEELPPFGAPWPLWPALTVIALTLFFMDVFFRRVVVDVKPVRKAAARVAARVPGLRRLVPAEAGVVPGGAGAPAPASDTAGAVSAPAPPGTLRAGTSGASPEWLAAAARTQAAPGGAGRPSVAGPGTRPGAPAAAAKPGAPAPAAGQGVEYTKRLLDAKKRALPKGRGGK